MPVQQCKDVNTMQACTSCVKPVIYTPMKHRTRCQCFRGSQERNWTLLSLRNEWVGFDKMAEFWLLIMFSSAQLVHRRVHKYKSLISATWANSEKHHSALLLMIYKLPALRGRYHTHQTVWSRTHDICVNSIRRYSLTWRKGFSPFSGIHAFSRYTLLQCNWALYLKVYGSVRYVTGPLLWLETPVHLPWMFADRLYLRASTLIKYARLSSRKTMY